MKFYNSRKLTCSLLYIAITRSKMGRVYVIGVGMTKFDKPGKRDDDYPEWGKEAILSALQDAKVNFNQVEIAAAGYVYGDSTCGQRVIYEVGMTGIPIFNVNNNCSTGSSALLIAKEMVESGKYNCALAVGFEKMQRGSLTSQFNDRANPMMKHVEAMSNLADIDGSPVTAQMFGNAGIEHMNKYGTKPEHFAKIAYKNHKHSVNNPKSQFRDLYTLEQIMQSPKVYGPLTKLQCCPTSDGAAAAIVASESFVKKHGLEGQAVEILGMEMATDLPSTFNANSHMCIVGYDMSKFAADKLYAKTGKRPSDVQVVELHDCFSANELITYEALGLCPPGKAGEMIDRGDNTYGGKYVINPSGGLISKGHPLGATGLAQCAELCWQLRGEAGPRQVPGAKLALQHNIGLGGAVIVALYQLGFPNQVKSKPNMANSGTVAENEFSVTPYLKILQQAMEEDEDGLIENHRAIYGLKIINRAGKTGYWVINCKQGKGKIEFNGKDKPDVTFIVKDGDIAELITGKIPPQKAFFQGKVKVQGNMGLAMKLTELQRTAAKKIEALRAKLSFYHLLSLRIYDATQNYGPSSQPEAYFNGSSYLRLLTTVSLKKQTGLSFRTCSNGGTLFSQTQNDDVIELIVTAEGLVFVAKTAGKTYEHKIRGSFINNKWHTVFLQYRLGNLTIDVDGETQLIANSSYRSDLLVSPGLYNEGAAVLLVGNHFEGCILEGPSIVFDPNIVLTTQNVVFEPCPLPYDSCVPNERAATQDFCVTEPCMRHGTCLSGTNSYTCVCAPRYTGKNCEMDLGNLCEKKSPYCKNQATCIPDGNGDFACVCQPGFTGRKCEHEIQIHPKCKNNPCLNGGICDYDPETDKTRCRCKQGYTGSSCETNIDDCQPNPCLNGGVCTDGFANFTCDCGHTGFKGVRCEVNVDECDATPCFNGGTCFDTYGSFLCQCADGFAGKNCQDVINDCDSRPCFNNGVCVSRVGGGYECRCLQGFFGDHCEVEQSKQTHCDNELCGPYAECVETPGAAACVCKPEYHGEYPNCNGDSVCIKNPCLNGGICTPYKGTFNCTCQPGFTGSRCKRVDRCKPTLCLNGGSCLDRRTHLECACANGYTGPHCETELKCARMPCDHAHQCVDFLGGYLCTCLPGWTGKNCDVPLGPCAGLPCFNNGTCVQHLGIGFHCVCEPGFEGKFCQTNINECLSNPCLNGGTCLDKINGFICNCTDDWMGTYCEKPFNICELNPCNNNATCTLASNKLDFVCHCLPGFEGKLCETNIDNCKGNKCPPAQTCHDLVNSYECRCPPGFTGEDCSIDIDPCSKNPCINGTCIVDKTTHQFSCDCREGFTGALCEVDIDECAVSGNKICNHGICVNSEGSFQCYCMPGYTGERCNVDFDECLSMPCKNNATCLNLINKYECQCQPGYEGKDCELNINECEPNPCMNGARCIDGVNEFSCVCQQGLTGKTCEINIDDCASSPCLHGAKCIDGLNSYTCDCLDTGYEGEHCENNIDDCKGNPCQNHAHCIDKVKDYDCECYSGYRGKNCEMDENECESNPCQFNGTCLERSNMTLYQPEIANYLNFPLPEVFNRPFNYAEAAGYECVCVPGVTGKNCETNINECDSNPCHYGTCTDKIGGYVCECEDGYEGEHCEIDIDECEKYKPCIQGTCIDKVANYYCKCASGYGGKNCSVALTGCENKPCLNKGVCWPYLVEETQHRFNCTCPNGYHGLTCEQKTTMSLNGNSLITVNSTKEEGYDIQFRFKTTLGDGLLALGKGITYYILELSKGRLNLHSSLLNKWEGVFIGSNLNDSKWQKVFVAINSSHLVLSANDEQTIYPISYNENNNATSTGFPVTYIGGFPSNLRKLTHGQPFLVGCTEDILINGEWVLPQERGTPWMSFQNVEVGCIREPQCKPNPCHSGGHCTDKWRDFSCTCERPYLGHTCQYNYTAATFGYENITNSLVTVNVADYARRAVRSIVDISMFIRTRQPRGQIFYLGSRPTALEETYIAAQLENGELLVKIQFNGPLEAYTVGGVKLDNGYNHLIQVIRNVTLVQVKLNGTEYFRKTISATGMLDAQVLYLGGMPPLRSTRQTNELLVAKELTPPTAPSVAPVISNGVHFKGIIQDVQISNGSSIMVVEFFPLQADGLDIPAPFGRVEFDNSTVLKGVRSDNSCRVNHCHHGTCENTWNDYRCICPRGYKGKVCNELEFCELEGCPQGSLCKNLEDSFECISNSTFNGLQNPMKYTLAMFDKETNSVVFDSVEVNYRTRSWGTVLFAKHKEDYFVVFIYHNEVVVEWVFDGNKYTKRFMKDRFEGQWLSLLFIYKDKTFKGGFREHVMDESHSFEVQDFDLVAFTEIFKFGEIFVAGSDNITFDYMSIIRSANNTMTGYIPVSDTTTADMLISNSLENYDGFVDDVLYKVDKNKTTDNFKGCLGEIRVGGLLLPYFKPKEIYHNQTYQVERFELDSDADIKLGCILCYDTDCFNKGYCVNSTETYKCNCQAGYAADDCSIDINECENNQCRNNATCHDLVAAYECECLPGFDGEFCEKDIDECASNPCRHGGTCNDLIGTFKCDCPEGYVGKQCEAPLLITCDNKPCGKGATCKTGPNEQTGNNFTCTCAEGMVGVLCDAAFCEAKGGQGTCENDGTCNKTGPVPYCECARGFKGKYCEINIDECVSPTGGSMCQNGGVCIDGIARYDCNCTGTGYTGLLCEIDIDECFLNPMACGTAGKCENMPGSYRCICDTIKGKCGHQCDLDDPCQGQNPCEHGTCQSQCTEKPDYLCICEENYTGKNCTAYKVAASHSESDINILYIIIPVVLILMVCFIIGMAYLVNIARSKRATRGTYSPSAQEFCNPRVELDHVLKPPPEERLI